MASYTGELLLLSIGHLTLDDVVQPDGTTRFDSPGGAALYAAVGALIWDARVGLVSRVGDGYEDEQLKVLVQRGLITDALVRKDRPNIHIWALYDREGLRYFIPQRWAGSYEDMAPRPAEVPNELLSQSRGVHIAPLPFPYQIDVLAAVRSADVVSLDPHHDFFKKEYVDRWREILPDVDVLLPSEDELLKFYEIGFQEDIADYVPYLVKLSEMGPRIVVLKLGARGAMVFNREMQRCVQVPSIADRVVDVTGAGDSFCGGFLQGLVREEDETQALVYGAVSASFAVEDYGMSGLLSATHDGRGDRLERLRPYVQPVVG